MKKATTCLRSWFETAASMARFAVFIVLFGAIGCSHETAEEVESETVVPVTTAAAMTGTIRASLDVTGTVTAAPDADQLVIAPQPARIVSISKAEGDLVKAGDVLVQFQIPSLAADIATRRAELARAKARLENAGAAQARAHDLFDRGIAARKEVEDADRELADAQAGLTEAEGTLAAADTAAGQTTVHARFNGVVAKRLHNPGELADASASDPVMRIVDPRRLEVTASVPIPDVARVVVGARAHMAALSGGADIGLKVLSRPAAVDAGTAAVPIRLAIVAGLPSEKGGGNAVPPIGTPVRITIDAEEHHDVVLVPAVAVLHEGTETAVFVANGNKAERRAVKVGLNDATHAEITDGIKAGDMVIVNGQAGLPDGARIAVAPTEPKS